MEHEYSQYSPVPFYGALTLTVVALAFCVYFLIPNINHVFIPAYARPTLVHYKYVGVAGGVAVLGIIGSLITRPRRGAK